MQRPLDRWGSAALVLIAAVLAVPGTMAVLAADDDDAADSRPRRRALAGPDAGTSSTPPGRGGFTGPRRGMNADPGRVITRILGTLDLSEDQKRKVRAITEEAREKRQAFMAEHREELEKINAQIREWLDKRQALMAKAPGGADTLEKIKSALTEDQVAQLETTLERIRGRFGPGAGPAGPMIDRPRDRRPDVQRRNRGRQDRPAQPRNRPGRGRGNDQLSP